VDWFTQLNPVWQALLAGVFTWGMTALGAALVVFTKKVNRKALEAALGMAAGVMMAGSFWSLLAPAVDMCRHMGAWKFLPPVVGFLLGAGFFRLVDRLLPHLHPGLADPPGRPEGPATNWRRSVLLVLAMTIHNFPEGLALGVAFGGAAAMQGAARIAQIGSAVALTIGIGIQDFPEGAAVSLPLRREGLRRGKALWYGQLSGVVEPIAAVLGAALVLWVRWALPYTLGFAAGAMIFVVVEELIPESQQGGHVDLATLGLVLGFAIMMTLEVALS